MVNPPVRLEAVSMESDGQETNLRLNHQTVHDNFDGMLFIFNLIVSDRS